MREFTTEVTAIRVQLSLNPMPNSDDPNYAAVDEVMDLMLRDACGVDHPDRDNRLVETCLDSIWIILEYDNEADMVQNLPKDTRHYREKFMTLYNECIWRANKRADLQAEYDTLDEKRVDAANGVIIARADEIGMWEFRMGQIQKELDDLRTLRDKDEAEQFQREQARYDQIAAIHAHASSR